MGKNMFFAYISKSMLHMKKNRYLKMKLRMRSTIPENFKKIRKLM